MTEDSRHVGVRNLLRVVLVNMTGAATSARDVPLWRMDRNETG